MSGAASRRLRVCLVGPSLDILGGQAVILDRMRRRMRELPELDVSFIPLNPRLPGALGALQRVKYVRTAVNTVAYLVLLLHGLRKVDVVHAFSASYWSFLLSTVPPMLIGRLYGKAVVMNYHSGEADDHLTHWRSARLGARLAHVIAVPSGYLVDVFRRHGLEATAVLNFVEVDAIPFRVRAVLRPRFLSNRNLEPLYDVACSIRAFALVQREVPEASLVVAGDGSQRVSLERLVAALGLRHVEFVGRTPHDEMGARYDAADVYLNSPAIDNMPSSVLEAFAAGLPVVTTDAGGIPYIVRHEENGLLVPRGDAEALAREALRLLRDPALASRLSLASRQECLDRFVWPPVRDGWLRLYAQARDVASRRRAAPQPGEA